MDTQRQIPESSTTSKPAGAPQLGGRLRTLPIGPAPAADPAARRKRDKLRAGTQRALQTAAMMTPSCPTVRLSVSNANTIIIINNVAPVCLPFRPSVRRSLASANPAQLGTGLSPSLPACLSSLSERRSITAAPSCRHRLSVKLDAASDSVSSQFFHNKGGLPDFFRSCLLPMFGISNNKEAPKNCRTPPQIEKEANTDIELADQTKTNRTQTTEPPTTTVT
ncbi:hypothetical protein Q8A73_021788 [Channa argus]|nr:hypothetical protein Q8A73_021788 [Channa argus]